MHIVYLLHSAECGCYGSYFKCQFCDIKSKAQCAIILFFVCHVLSCF